MRIDIKMGSSAHLPRLAHRKPHYWVSGVRRKGNVNLIEALIEKAGTCHSDAKGEFQETESSRKRVPMRRTGADWPVVAMKFL